MTIVSRKYFALLALVNAALLVSPVCDAYAEDAHENEEHASIKLSAEQLEALHITVGTVTEGKIILSVPLSGVLVPKEDKVAHVTPRFPGIIREVRKKLGDRVQKDEVVAIVESNQTLQTYEVHSLADGVVIARHAAPGELAGQSSILEIADYTELFAELFVFPVDAGKISVGQRVTIVLPESDERIPTTLSFISPVTDQDTQSRFVRGPLKNVDGHLQPGTFISGEVVIDEVIVPTSVEASAVRTMGNTTIVFVEDDGEWTPRTVVVGRKGQDRVEIVRGLAVGERYAAGDTFSLQAELEKGEAEHED